MVGNAKEANTVASLLAGMQSVHPGASAKKGTN
jgi:hypothetical protein